MTTAAQGAVELLEHDTATRLLNSTEPARLAYVAHDGTFAVAGSDRPGVRMARIALRRTWVGVLDFQTRLPGGRR
jgi:hypothetical protein